MTYPHERQTRDKRGRRWIIQAAIAVVLTLGGVAGGVEIAGDLDDIDTCEYDD